MSASHSRVLSCTLQMDAVSDLQGLVKQLTLERNSARDLYDKVAKELTVQVSEQHSLRQLCVLLTGPCAFLLLRETWPLFYFLCFASSGSCACDNRS